MIEHINHVETPGIFGRHMEILAMATYYGVPVFYCCLQGHSLQRHFVRPISSKDNHLRYPELAGSPLEHVEPPTHFELSYMHNTHYNSIVSLTGELRNDLPELNHEEVHVVEVLYKYSICWAAQTKRVPCIGRVTVLHVRGRYEWGGYDPPIIWQFGSLHLTILKNTTRIVLDCAE